MKLKIVSFLIAIVSAVQVIMPLNAKADGGNYISADTVSIEKMLEEIPADEIIVTECHTGKILFEKNSVQEREISHLTKLMTLLIAAEKLESGEISLDDKVTVSANANSMEGSQIWLDKGEKIRLEELIKSISIGNANDACVALAEHISGSEKDFTDEMNSKAKLLDMAGTHFADCTGMSDQSRSNAADMALLAAEIVKYKSLAGYLTVWRDFVRDGKAELVSQNRLVRTYNGITGMKACSSRSAGECSVVTAEKNGMCICVVILGCESSEARESASKKLLDMSFDAFQIYSPEIAKDMLKDIPVTGGEYHKIKVEFGTITPVIIPRGSYNLVEVRFEKKEEIAAPVKKNETVGKLSCILNNETILKTELRSAESVKKMNFKFGFLKLLYNLIG